MKASGPRLSDKGHALCFPADKALPYRQHLWRPVFGKMEAKADERGGGNLGQGEPIAGEGRGVNQLSETIISIVLLPSLCRIKAQTVSPLCTKEGDKNHAPQGDCSEIRGQTEKEKKKKDGLL